MPPPPPSSIPLLHVNPAEVSFYLQSGLVKDSVSIETNELNLKSLKDLAINFVDRKVSLLLLTLPFTLTSALISNDMVLEACLVLEATKKLHEK